MALYCNRIRKAKQSKAKKVQTKAQGVASQPRTLDYA